MTSPALFSILLLCVALLLYLHRRRNAWQGGTTAWPLYAQKPKPRPAQLLHQRLQSALPAHSVLAGVALTDVLGVRRGFDARKWSRRLRHVQYDFVVCAKDGSVLGAIALDDIADDGSRRRRSEQLKERASAAAGLRLLRWHTKALPSAAEIREAFGHTEAAFFEEAATSANASWWPPVARQGRDPFAE